MGQSKLGVYLVNTHDRAENWDYIQKLQPKAIRLLDPNVSLIKRVYDLLPNTVIFPRYWSISEEQDRYVNQPVNLANEHTQFWKEKIAEYERNGMSRGRFVTVSTNEPTIWSSIDRNSNHAGWLKDMERIYKYNLDYNMTLAHGLGKENIKSCLLNFSVGHPANQRDGELSYWKWAEPLVQPTRQYGHVWCIHEYWPKNGPQEGWGWYSGRWQHIPFDVPIVIGECGIDRYVNEPGVAQHQRGWKSVVSARDYAIQLNSYAAHLELDKRVFACFPFLTDYADNKWQSFDTMDAREEILKEKNVPYQTYLPVIITTGGTKPPVEPEKPPVTNEGNGYKLYWPPLSPITNFFGGEHNGLDIGIPTGTEIRALADGDVAWSELDTNTPSYGEYIRLYHKQLGVHSFYGHLSKRLVKQGEKVKKGQLIGYSGWTGTVKPVGQGGSHLHFEIRLANPDGSYKKGVSPFHAGQCDPIAYLNALANILDVDGNPIGHY